MANGQPSHPNGSSNFGSPPQVSLLQMSANKRKEIDDNPEFKALLEEWGKQWKEDELKLETYRGRCIAAKAELYQHLSLYVLFQGVVFGAVSNGANLTCQTSLFPATVSFLTSLATVFSVHSKLGDYKLERMKFIRAEAYSKNLNKKISRLKNVGKEFKSEDSDDSQTSIQKKQADEASAQNKFYWAVMFFLFLFSVIILASCVFALCYDTPKSKLTLCALHKCHEFAFH